MKDKLVQAARAVAANAYAPYSVYHVGAAVLDGDGRVFVGVNVENVSYGATICAERSAICQMVAQGGRAIRAIAVATKDGGTPCGICLQVIAEFCPDIASVDVYCVNEHGRIESMTLGDLLPFGFKSDMVPKKEGRD